MSAEPEELREGIRAAYALGKENGAVAEREAIRDLIAERLTAEELNLAYDELQQLDRRIVQRSQGAP